MARKKLQMKPVTDGLIGGLGRELGAAFLGDTIGGSLGEAAAGYWTGNDTGMYLAGREFAGGLGGRVAGGIREVIG